ncbi:MAG TPA: carboxypeptidase-like regulatory domain-containing protein [Ferruginibacter sp.]|nr:carboxypeptidase-like regulatory domain-containing protein [Ferruginibacter sp.]
MGHLYKTYFLIVCLLFVAGNIFGQLTVSGTVYDSTRTIPVKNVLIKSKTGHHVVTDSVGYYTIPVQKNDSLVFIYRNKSTPEFAVSEIEDRSNFDVALRVRVLGKFKTLKEVTITSRSYQEDSIENRQDYEHIFDYHRPGLQTSIAENSGNAGLDLDELIDAFRFRRNKELHLMQQRLEEEEREKYVDYRFNKVLIKRITTIDSTDIDVFMKRYRPGFEFTQSSTIADFYQYILNASYQFEADKTRRDSLSICR